MHALNNISFTVGKGQTLGIIGQNGAGKSTLLKILTGVIIPDSGGMDIQGRITGLLELGTGFNGEFSGIDNIFLNGTYLGLSRNEIKSSLQDIIDFTELGVSINEPIKTYSSGMVMRLAFSIAIHAMPNCFVVDEALSVGDAYFQQKCMQRIKAFKASGGAMIFVSHDMNAVKVLCDKVLLLDHGVVLEEGSPDKIIEDYNYLIARKAGGEALQPVSENDDGYGNFKVRFASVQLLNENNQVAEILRSGQPARIELELDAKEDVPAFNVGVLLRDKFGQDIFGTNTFYMNSTLSMQAGQKSRLSFLFERLNLGPGKYTLTVAAHRGETHTNDCHHWIDRSLSFEVVHGEGYMFIGLSRLETKVVVSSN